ncbi:MAG: TusE/DsrC/DsvC family sulfur relay protein [Proteobacteria bacterium]|nr:MAG: TusE/DsrC/DsvC family sulfur relay protein [Pseudomonadota bacterium]
MTTGADTKTLETTEMGYPANVENWNEDAAVRLAVREGLGLTERHRDVLGFLRTEFFNNNDNQTNNRAIIKQISANWGHKVSNKVMFDLFPDNPSKRAGLPESRRKSGY